MTQNHPRRFAPDGVFLGGCKHMPHTPVGSAFTWALIPASSTAEELASLELILNELVPSPSSTPASRLFPARQQRRASTTALLVWRLCLAAAAAALLAVGASSLGHRAPGLGIWLTALCASGGWLAAVVMLLAHTRFRILWILWLGAGLFLLLSPDQLNAARFTVFLFLVLRRYRPLGHLSSSQRGWLFLLSLLCLPLLVFGITVPGSSDGARSFGQRLASYSTFSLGFFWAMVLVHLSFRARLHFLRLKLKLAVAAAFIAFVPLVLVIALGILGSYGALGGRTADRGKDVLLDWSRLVDDRPETGQVLFQDGFADPGPSLEKAPHWVPQFRQALAQESAGENWAPCDTTAFFVLGQQMWLLKLDEVASGSAVIHGWPVGEPVLDRLSSLLRGDVGIAISLSTPGAFFGHANPDEGDILVTGRYHPQTDADSSNSFLRKPIYFGGAMLDAFKLDGKTFTKDDYVLTVRVRLEDLARDFLTGSNKISLGLTVLLAVLAGLFLFVELGSLFFGLRIASGITSAVKTLHRGTKELARGNLEVHIEVPNEDEFGDLAESFNEMTQAVKRGQEELLARERFERELETAREIQRRLLPYTVPQVEGFQITGISEPTRQVGGDYYDFLLLDNGRIGVAVGDVSGKGIPAALLMSNLQASLKGQILHPSRVSQTVSMVNQLLVSSTDMNMFATFFYGELDPRDGSMVATNAGHDPPILCRSNGHIDRISTGGLVLGVMEGIPYKEEALTIERGDVLVIYTDGITEAQGPLEDLPDSDDEAKEDDRVNLFEEERLIEVIRSNRHRSAQEIQALILDAVRRHTAGTPQSDDITLVVIKRELVEVTSEENPRAEGQR